MPVRWGPMDPWMQKKEALRGTSHAPSTPSVWAYVRTTTHTRTTLACPFCLRRATVGVLTLPSCHAMRPCSLENIHGVGAGAPAGSGAHRDHIPGGPTHWKQRAHDTRQLQRHHAMLGRPRLVGRRVSSPCSYVRTSMDGNLGRK